MESKGNMVGDSELVLDDNDHLLIKGKIYKGTPGLFELIFKSIPGNFTARDLKTYEERECKTSYCIYILTHFERNTDSFNSGLLTSIETGFCSN